MELKIKANHFLSEIFQVKCGRLYINSDKTYETKTTSITQNDFNSIINEFKFLECILPGNATAYVSILVALASIWFVFNLYLKSL